MDTSVALGLIESLITQNRKIDLSINHAISIEMPRMLKAKSETRVHEIATETRKFIHKKNKERKLILDSFKCLNEELMK